MRTDAQIVQETNDLARLLLAELVGTGYQVPEDHKFWEATDPRSQKAWATAVKAMGQITHTEVEDALNNYLDELRQVEAQQYQSPTGSLIVGAAETTPCFVGITGIRPDGSPEYNGSGSTMLWDDQVPRTRDGKRLFIDEHGVEWTFDQLTVIGEDEV